MLVALHSGAAAQSREVPAVAAIGRCRSVSDPAQRLVCYDKAAADFAAAVVNKDVVVLDRSAIQATRKGLFGFSLPKLPFFGGGDDDDDRTKHHVDESVREINTTIKSARSLGYGKWRIVIEDGAVWLNTDPITRTDPKAGLPIRIKRALLGSYDMFIGDGRSVKAKREN